MCSVVLTRRIEPRDHSGIQTMQDECLEHMLLNGRYSSSCAAVDLYPSGHGFLVSESQTWSKQQHCIMREKEPRFWGWTWFRHWLHDWLIVWPWARYKCPPVSFPENEYKQVDLAGFLWEFKEMMVVKWVVCETSGFFPHSPGYSSDVSLYDLVETSTCLADGFLKHALRIGPGYLVK